MRWCENETFLPYLQRYPISTKSTTLPRRLRLPRDKQIISWSITHHYQRVEIPKLDFEWDFSIFEERDRTVRVRILIVRLSMYHCSSHLPLITSSHYLRTQVLYRSIRECEEECHKGQRKTCLGTHALSRSWISGSERDQSIWNLEWYSSNG